MQKQNPIRYYITKRGEEPTVRSVRVEQSVLPVDAAAESTTNLAEEPALLRGDHRRAGAGVRRIVKDAIGRRATGT